MNSARGADPADAPIRSIHDIEALERVPLETQQPDWTVPALIRRGAAIDPARPALHYLPEGRVQDPPDTVSHAQLLQRMHQAANLFHAMGVGPRDAVAIVLPTLPQNYAALLGAMTAGIAFPINWMLQPGQIAVLLRAARVKVLVALGPRDGFDIWQKVQALPETVRRGLRVLQVGAGTGVDGPAPDFDQACRALPGTQLRFEREIAPDAVAVYIHTGGTTGSPKIARISHRAIAYKCWAYSVLLAQRPHHVALGVSPLFHVGGIVLRAISPLSRGMTVVIPGPTGLRNKEVVRDYWKLVQRYRITELSGVPTSLGALADVPVDGADIASLRPFAVTGSSALSAEVARRLERQTGVRLLVDYGLTEATATVALPPRDGPPRAGSSGLRLPYTRIRIVVFDPHGRVERECAAGEIGEIIVSGPGLAAGYLDPALDAALFVDGGWLRTGDLGRLDADGWLWLTGRAKDLIIRGGHNIDPRVIEETLMAHEAVALAAAVGQPDAYAGELPVAYVQLRPQARASAEALVAFARERIAERAAAPVAVFVVDALPMTGVGKVFKPELRERATRHVLAGIVRCACPHAGTPVIHSHADPVRGTLWRITLPVRRDAGLARRLQAELGRLAFACELSWDDSLE